uniref:Uncharacterized protein n=1 Tax=viral metagenome TaxID=1070528 RepID=A0A6C0BBE2_9ZZZZ
MSDSSENPSKRTRPNEEEDEEEIFKDAAMIQPLMPRVNGKIAIVLITTHGEIPLDSNNEPEYFTLPEKTIAAQLNAVSAGVCNFLSSTVSEIFAKNIIKNRSELLGLLSALPLMREDELNEVLSNDGYSSKIKSLISQFKYVDKATTVAVIAKNLKIASKDDLQYYHHFDKAYQLRIGTTMLNKTYSRKFKDLLCNDGPWDFKITVLTEETPNPEQVDLIQEIEEEKAAATGFFLAKQRGESNTDALAAADAAKAESRSVYLEVIRATGETAVAIASSELGKKESEITSKEIAESLHKKGIVSYLVVDLACSGLATSDFSDLNERETRCISRQINKKGGKKSKRKNKKNKTTRKNKIIRKTKNTRNKRKTRKNKTTRKK